MARATDYIHDDPGSFTVVQVAAGEAHTLALTGTVHLLALPANSVSDVALSHIHALYRILVQVLIHARRILWRTELAFPRPFWICTFKRSSFRPKG